jgi:hypothetical protein
VCGSLKVFSMPAQRAPRAKKKVSPAREKSIPPTAEPEKFCLAECKVKAGGRNCTVRKLA